MRPLLSGLTAAALVASLAATAPLASAQQQSKPPLVTAEPASTAGEITSLGRPLQDVLLIGGTVAPGPDGSTVAWSVSSGAPAHLNAVDPETGDAVARLDLPGAGGSWAVDSAPDGSVYVGSYGEAKLFRWTAAGGVQDLGNPVPGESFVWDVTVADDGQVYGGTSPGGKLFGYDPSTGAFRDYGKLSDSHAYIRSVAVHGDTIFAGTENPAAVIQVDRTSGAQETLPLPDGLDNADAWAYDVDVAGDYLYVRFGTAFPAPLHVWSIAEGRWVDVIESAHGLEPSPPDNQGRVYVIAHGELVRYDPADGSETPTGMPFLGRVANTRGIGWAELREPEYAGPSLVGMLWRGLTFRYNPASGAYSFIQSGVQGEPIDITALAEGPDGRVYTGGFLNGGFAAVDPASGRREEFHTFSQSEAMTTHDGKLYLGAYPEARVYSYSPSVAWNSPEYSPAPTPGLDENPLRLFDLKADKQIRPRALASAGDYLAVGTMPDLGELGGVFALYDADTGELAHSQRNLIADESIVALAYRDGIVYGSTSIYSGQSATPPTQPEATVFAWSVAERRLLWELPAVPGKPTIASLTFDAQGHLWGIAGQQLFAIDIATGEVVKRLSFGSSSSSSGDLAFNSVDGYLYASPAGALLIRINPSTLGFEILRTGVTTHLAAHSSGAVYFNAGSELLRFTPRCTTSITGTHNGSLAVSSGTLCIEDARVSGSVSVSGGANLLVRDSRVAGAVSTDAASSVRISGSTLAGSVTLANTSGDAPIVSNNTIYGALSCEGNAEAPTDEGSRNDIVGARSGQCANL